MKLLKIPLRKALNPVYRKQQLLRQEMEDFKGHLRTLLERINTDESEENAKGHLMAFLNNTYYQGEYLIATKGRADMVIHGQKSASSNPAVLFEVKRPRDKGQTAAEMMRPDKGNVKALHELILYFLRERIEHQNTDLKYLVVTDIHQWFVFDAADFERLFYKNRQLVKDYKDWRDGRKTGSTTDFFYQEIAQPMVASIAEEVPCTQFDVRDYAKYALNDDPKDDHKLIGLYKILSPAHLLRLPFANDSNSLNKDFYYELLHLIGLAETKDKNKKVIQRKPEGERHNGSLLENAIRTLETEDRLRRVPKLSSYGSSREEQLFGVALELCITWVNRILFLKLLEAQLLKYHQGDQAYRFLNKKAIKDYDELNELFFEALAKRKGDRLADIADKFAKVPYLNSSLFEISEMEDVTIRINSMKDRFALPLYPRTVLKDEKGKRLTGEYKVLDYLFAFLDAYDFSSEGSESIQEENKNLINASVLGLIFEKINGYQDGAFFTPGFITMYMCRETLRRATVQKFRESDHFAEFDSEGFGDLQNYLARKYAAADLQAANTSINSLKICDPAVGSGHFLVSALNELLTIKSELGILCDRQGKPLAVRLEVANDELSIQWRNNDDFYEYQPGVHDNHLVQEALFYEKQNLIENCLFGVDLNPNSVKICRLRLWIELLKNAYYRKDGELETLPNIDINIKQGNSLVSRFALDADLKPVLAKSKWTITDYQLAVSSYQHATEKSDKQELLAQINRIKSDFQIHIYNNDPLFKKLSKLRGQKLLLENKAEIGNLFEKLSDKDITSDLKKLNTSIEKIEAEVENIRDAKIYENAFEWRFEFPEVLDGEGSFVGFDAILGNPPYIRQEEFSDLKPYLKSQFTTFSGTADLLVYFIERSHQVLRPDGQFSFIISNKFMRAGFGKALREWLSERRLLEIIDFGDIQIFDGATTYPCILSWQKSEPKEIFNVGVVSKLDELEFNKNIRESSFNVNQSELSHEGWNLQKKEQAELLNKLNSSGITLEDYVDGLVFRGVTSGYDKAFVIDEETANEIIRLDSKASLYIKKYFIGRDVQRFFIKDEKRFFLFIPWDFDIEEYTSIKDHLLKHKPELSKRPEVQQGRFPWYSLSRYGSKYFEYFDYEKIVYQKFQVRPLFAFDNDGTCLNSALWFIPKKDFFLLGVLNSSMGWFLISKFCTEIQNGYQLIWKYLGKIPIAKEDDFNGSESIKKLVLRIIEQKLESSTIDTTALEAEIDLLVYHLYELTYEEVLLVDPEFELTEEEYNNAKPQ